MAERDRDELLRAMGKLAREEIEAEDRERFDRRTLFEPFDDEFKATLVRSLRRETAAHDERDSQDARPDTGFSARWRRFVDGLLGGGQVVNFEAVTLRLAAVAAVVLAAAVLYPVLRPAEGPLPRFELELQGARSERSGGETEAQLFKRGQRFNYRLQPGERLDAEPVLRIWARREGGGLMRWRAAEEAAEISGDGVVLARDLEWEWEPGRWTLYFAVGRSVPPEAELRRLLDGGPRPESAPWQLLTREVRVER